MTGPSLAVALLLSASFGGCVPTIAAATPSGHAVPSYPVPRDCTPTALTAVPPNVTVCVHDLLVTDTTASAEQDSSVFNAVDNAGHTLHGTVPKWWPSGGPVAGMVVTLWGKSVAGTFRADRWIEHNHGTGPTPGGPYPRRRLLDVAAGKYPALEMAWVIATTFALDPQDTGDGDIHVQTMLPCPAAGLTFETTPRVRGYVDHPGFNPALESTDETDPASNHVAEAPPIGVPVMMLGQLRVDFGFGWWEVHPVRAWRYLTPAETATLADECANAPVPVLDTSGPDGLPLPLGVPPCTDGSEFGNPGSIYKPCSPHCYVATTAIGKPQTTAGHCNGVLDTSASTGGSRTPGRSPTPVRASAAGKPGSLPGTAAAPPPLLAAAIGLLLLLGIVLAGRGYRRLR